MSSLFMTSLGEEYSSSSDSEEEKIQFIDEEEEKKNQQEDEDDFFMSSPKSEQSEENDNFFMTSADDGKESDEKEIAITIEEEKQVDDEDTPSNSITEKEDVVMQDTPSIIFITPSHTPFELTKSNIQVPIDTIHPSWKNSIVIRSIEQQKLEMFKEKFNGKAKSIKFTKPQVEETVAISEQVIVNKSNTDIEEKKEISKKVDTDSSSSSSSSSEDESDSSSSSSDSDSSSEEKEEKKEIVIKGQDINEYKQALKEINQSKKQERKQQMNTVLKKSSKHNRNMPNPKTKGGKKAIQKQQKMYREQLKKMPLKDIQFMGKKIKFDNTKKTSTEQ